MGRGIIIFLIGLLLAMGIVAAEEGIQFTEIDSKTILQPEELGEYTLLLENIGAKERNIQLSADPYAGLPTSDFEYVFVEPEYVVLSGHESIVVNVTMKLKDSVLRQKRYQSYITATTLNMEEESQKYDLQVFAMPPESAVKITILNGQEKVGPGGQLVLGMNLRNMIDEDLNNIDVYVTSELFNDKQTIELFEEQEKELEFAFNIAKTAPAGAYEYNIRLYNEEELLSSATGNFIVDENLNVTEYVEETSGFLYTKRTITLTNYGNSLVSDSYDEELTKFESWFTTYSIEPSYEDDAGTPTWTFSIAPEEKFVLEAKEDYRPLVIGIIAVLLIGLIAYYIFVKRVTIRKEAFKLKYSTDGISEFKVLLHLKNSTNKTIKDVNVVDVLPKLIQPRPNFGTLHPNGIERGDKGIRIMWKIPELVSGEERIISYEVEAQFQVIGDIALPNATVKFKNQRGRIIHIRSNKVNVIHGIVEKFKEVIGSK